MTHPALVRLLVFGALLSSVLQADSGLISTVAGNGVQGSGGLGGPATSANLNGPYAVCLDRSGNLFIADTLNSRIVRVDAATGILTLAAGIGSPGYSGDGGPATLAALAYPYACAFDPAGNLFIGDSGNNVVRRVNAASGVITTTVGNGAPGGSGDGGPASAASLWDPTGLAFDAAGNLYIADKGNCRIRRVDAATAVINTVAGTGVYDPFGGDGGLATNANLSFPWGIALDPANNLHISDTGHGRLRRVAAATGIITTIAGDGNSGFSGDGSSATSFAIGSPIHVGVDSSGYLFFVDGNNGRVRRVNLATGAIATVAGKGQLFRSSGDGGPATSAELNMPSGLALAANGNLFVSEASAHRVRRIFLPAPYAYTATNLASSRNPSSAGEPVTFTATVMPIEATGTPAGLVQFFDDLGVTLLGSAPLVNGTASFTTSTLASGPHQPGVHQVNASYSGDASFSSSTSPEVLQIVKLAASVTLSSSQSPSDLNQAVTLTATVVPAIAQPFLPTGTIEFRDGGTSLGTVAVAQSQASLAVSFNTPGQHPITAVYSGDLNYGGSTSPVLNQMVRAASATTVASAPNPSTFGAAVTITASVSPGAATGAVEFRVDGATIGTAPLAGGQASLVYSAMATGSHTISAVYSGDAGYTGSSSPPLAHVVKAVTTTYLVSNLQPSSYGQAVQFLASVAPGSATGAVQFLEGSTVLGTVSLAGGQATLVISTLAAGDHSITAVYGGDASHEGSISAPLIQTVLKANPSIAAATSPNPSLWGQSVTLTALVAPATATGSVQFKDGVTTLGTAPLINGAASLAVSGLAVGNHSITGVYTGDANHNAATSPPWTHTVNKAPSSTSLASSPNPATRRQAVTFTATVSPAAATGTVQFFDGATLLGSASLSAGRASITKTLAAGTHSITARYSGDANYAGSTSPALIQTVTKN